MLEGLQDLADKVVNRGVPNRVVASVRHHAVVELQRELDAQRSAADGGVSDPARALRPAQTSCWVY